ncbi:MAG: hypothetical protein DMC57_06525 [Verrucomicrobia bacterium]|nr:MAG: hypothetical protein DMC57_06525 [Verrucomicrobiota bacterium]
MYFVYILRTASNTLYIGAIQALDSGLTRTTAVEAPDEGKLSLNWNPEVRPKMRVVLWTYPKGGITDNLPSGSGKSRKGEISVLWRARERVSMNSNDPRHTSELSSFCKSDQPMRPGADGKEWRWIA